MIELDVATRRKPVAVKDDPRSDYLVLGDFGGCAAGPLAINRHTFDETLSRFEVSIGTMRFHKLDDFHPDRLCQRVPLLRDSAAMPPAQEEEPAGRPQPNLEELLRSSSLLEQITKGIDPFQQYMRELARAYASPEQSPEQSDDRERNAALSERMRAVLHHPQFQAIESAWRGVDFLVRRMDFRQGENGGGANSGANGGARVFLAQYTRDDAARDLLDSANHRDTRIQELLISQRWRAVAGLYQFGPDASDIELLRQLAVLAARVRAPFVSACSLPEGSLDMGPYWSGLTSVPEADHVGLALPRFLLRLPYGARTAPIDSFAFEEMPGDPVRSRYLWGNPALACLSLLARGDGTLDLTDLPLHVHNDKGKDEGEADATPCEVRITEVQELALIDAGLMPLVPSAKSDCARLAGFRAINGTDLPVA
jgi:type VI secretion system protein ImpC